MADEKGDIEIEGVSEPIVKALRQVGIRSLTPVQTACLPHCLTGCDVLAKAKTGTGKTLAFLIPTVERLVRKSSVPTMALMPEGIDPVRALVLSSTRELAAQIVSQAENLVRFIPGFNIDIVLGGSSITPQRERLDPKLNGQFKYGGTVDLMIATPGRLIEHIESTDGFESRMLGVEILVLDEVDQLLDGGFQRNIEAIISKIPISRQTLCFSATVPDRLLPVLNIALRDDHVVVDCVGKTEVDTHATIEQHYVIHTLEQSLLALYDSIRFEILEKPEDYKILVFLPTARQTQFSSAVLQQMGVDVMEIHSRRSQNERTSVSDTFRSNTKVVLFSSDVSARGVDYPDVTLVLQVGAPTSKEVYVQRLGRTGRAGKTGTGTLLLADYEKSFLLQLKGLPITEKTLPLDSCEDLTDIQHGAALVEDDLAVQTYRAWVMSMVAMRKTFKWTKQDLVNNANLYGRAVLGRASPPPIQREVVDRLGLSGLVGLNIVDESEALQVVFEEEEEDLLVKVNKKDLGLALKKDAKAATDALAALEEAEALELGTKLAEVGEAEVAGFKILKEWVSVERRPKAIPRSESASSMSSMKSDSSQPVMSVLRIFTHGSSSLTRNGSVASFSGDGMTKSISAMSLSSIDETRIPETPRSTPEQLKAAFDNVSAAGAFLSRTMGGAKGDKAHPDVIAATEALSAAKIELKKLEKNK